MLIYALGPDEALASLQGSRQGLGDAEAARRLAEYGENRIERVARDPLWRHFLREFTHLFAVLLWAAAALAFAADWRDPGAGMGALGWAIVGVILVNGAFSFWQEYRAEQVLASLEALLPRQVTLLRGGMHQRHPASAIVPGDLVVLQEGDGIPADCVVIEARDLRVNLASVTGESLPRRRGAEPSGESPLIDARNVLLAGTEVVAGHAVAVAFATGRHTQFGQIARLSQHTRPPPSPLYREIARLSRVIALLAVALGGGFLLIGLAIGQPFSASFVFAIGVTVANVPEGLLPTVTLALALAARRMARRRALVRHLPAVEALGGASVIVSDKTGTLTENRLAVARVWFDGHERAPAALPTMPDAAAVLDVVAHCHSLEWLEAQQRWQGDPLEVALMRLDPGRRAQPRLDELPFDAERRRMSTLHRAPDGSLRLCCKGALEALLPLCNRMRMGGVDQPLDAATRKAVMAAEGAMADRGLRVLALAARTPAADEPRDAWERELALMALVGLADPPRAEVPAAIAQCHAAGVRVVMATGDHPHTALAVARQIGLVRGPEPRVLTGEGLLRMSAAQLQLALDHPEVICARVSAGQKLVLVQALQAKGHVVAVTGDGVNDAPALRAADIGVAMGRGGTDVARESADVILLDDNFATIVAAIEEGRAVYRNLRKFLTYILSSNVPELVPYLAFALFRIPLPLTIMQILAVDLGTDMVPALALGAEPPHAGIMREPPRPRTERLLTRGTLLRAYLFLGVLEAAAAMTVFFVVLGAAGWSYGEALAADDLTYRTATTATLVTIVVMQMINVLLCRDPRRSLFAPGPPAHPLLALGLAVELGLALFITYAPWGQALFATAALPGWVWLLTLPFAALMLTLEELRKALARRRASLDAGQ